MKLAETGLYRKKQVRRHSFLVSLELAWLHPWKKRPCFSEIGSTLHPLLARIDISASQREDKQDSRQTQVGRIATDKSGRRDCNTVTTERWKQADKLDNIKTGTDNIKTGTQTCRQARQQTTG